MEDVLDLYQAPYEAERPVVCMDETSKQLVEGVQPPLPRAPGRAERVDYEYRRNGTASVFMFLEPLAGRRRVAVRERRTAVDWAHEIRRLLNDDYPDAEVVRLVMDNLNTHSVGSLYEAFPPEEARRLASRLEVHYTPKHASWLNVAEVELSVLSRQCLDRRIPSRETLTSEVEAWETRRNRLASVVDWQFRTPDARLKLKRLYPVFEEDDDGN
jgi:hypothetical protein